MLHVHDEVKFQIHVLYQKNIMKYLSGFLEIVIIYSICIGDEFPHVHHQAII